MKPHQARLEISYRYGDESAGLATDAVAADAASGNVGKAAGSGSAGSAIYTVVKGDNLWDIAKRFYGDGSQYMAIYNANTEVIESTAKAHGKANSYKGSTPGWWIWPGEVLEIPGLPREAAVEAPGQGGAGIAQGILAAAASAAASAVANKLLGIRMATQATAFSYTDVASGQSDSISITLQDIGKEWMGKFMPRRGASLGAKISLVNWGGGEGEDVFDCGEFVLDDISFSGRPLACVLGGVSVPAMDDFKSLPVTRTWEKSTVQDIAAQIAAKAGVALYYDADAIQVAEIEQNRVTDSAFLYSLCDKYGLAMKIYGHKIVIFDIVRYEEKEAVATLREGDGLQDGGHGILSWTFNTTVDGTYTGVKLDYTSPDAKEPIKVSMGSPGRMYSMNTQASSQFDAELQAAAKVNGANRKIQTMEVTIRGAVGIVASQCVMVAGLGYLSGKYYVDKAIHSIGKGYTIRLSLHKVQAAVKVNMPVPVPAADAAGAGGTAYTVVKGDSLWGIAKRFYGDGSQYMAIYNANTEVIESTAKAHGKANSYKGSTPGWWIWPGETLVIPGG